jgi:acyl-CoA synthetase (AMP-forming)/AMP-acid ligase II/acyl carrier protein
MAGSLRWTSSDSLVDVVASLAESEPTRPAYVFLADGATESGRLTPAELDLRARAVAARLREEGLTGKQVLLVYPTGLDFIVSFFACLYAGAVAVPVYPPNPAALDRTLPRFRAIAADARASAVLTSSPILAAASSLLRGSELGGLRWIASDEVPAERASAWRRPDVGRDSLAFLQYTSGSTGAPRGVMVSHGNLLSNLAYLTDRMVAQSGSPLIESGKPDWKAVSWLPLYHDMGLIVYVLQTLVAFETLYLMPPEAFLRRPFLWLDAMSRYRASISGFPNFALELCVRRTTPEERAGLDLSAWKVAQCGGEPIRSSTLARFFATFEPCGFRREAFFASYGLAESTVGVSGGLLGRKSGTLPVARDLLERGLVEIVPPERPSAKQIASCGAPDRDHSIAIVDPETCTRAAPGQVGELWISGEHVAKGYFGDQEETARTFRARLRGESGPDAERHFLRTGDLGFLHQGELYITGRLKDLIIIRGVNRYPQDIEGTVEESHPLLRRGSAAAFAVDVDDEEQLVVAVEVTAQASDSTEDINRAIRNAVLRAHLVAVHTVVLLAPGSGFKTSSGKIQRRAYRNAFLRGELREAARFEPLAGPRTASTRPTSAEVLAAPPWEREGLVSAYLVGEAEGLLGQTRSVDPRAPVTSLGLDSVHAVEMSYRLERKLGVAVSHTDFLAGAVTLHQVAQEIAREIDTRALSVAEAAPAALGTIHLPPLGRSERTGELPLSFNEERVCLLDRLFAGQRSYTQVAPYRLKGMLDRDALERAIGELVRRHEILRTRYVERDGRWTPVIGESARAPFAREPFAAGADLEARLEERVSREARSSIPLDSESMVRMTLLEIARDDHALLFLANHIVLDAWTVAILMREIAMLYFAFSLGAPSPLPEPPVQHVDYAAWQRGWLRGEVLEQGLDHWQRTLAGAALDARISRRTTSGAAAQRLLVIPGDIVTPLRTLCERSSVTLFMALMAAFKVILARRTGTDDVCVVTPMANRLDPMTNELVGFLSNPVVLRTSLAGDPTVDEVLDRVRSACLSAYRYQHVPYHLIAERLRPAHDLETAPPARFVFQNFVAGGFEPELLNANPAIGLQVSWIPHAVVQEVPSEIVLSVSEGRGGDLVCYMFYDAGLLSEAEMASLGDDYVRLLTLFGTGGSSVRLSRALSAG